MKKLYVLSVAFLLLSCNSNEKKFPAVTSKVAASNIEMAKSTVDQMFENAHHYENKKIMAPYGSKVSTQLDSIKLKLTDRELKEIKEYAEKKFDEQYPQS
ncbi:hypothetical protein LZ575_19735 [Antarcticibacterium sp. 1MA-6-2]|uniref:hypothetical protein n=1 Tax=Antarcticibacterium sp. 1MA-6-2 TaxID=2908210 RepID=UPI001F3946AA|nr:hypothetical protein [Antarcticibacterium sp. 1MA-6-2]UJH90905.1 hypothetical protein LZ575_19735 [Antarcticibacterium sp. 1MA-6-2]